MGLALRPPVSDPKQAKFNQRLFDKIKYCKEVLVSIKNASSSSGSGEDQQVQGQGEDPEGFGMPGGPPPMSTRSSKQSLR